MFGMKYSSELAAAALIGRSLCPGKKTWKDAVLAAIIAKNEMLDKDGIVRKLIVNGATDNEIAELTKTLEKEIQKQQQIRTTPKKSGFLAGFIKGWKGERV